MSDENHKMGYYEDKQEGCIAKCCLNDTEDHWKFFDARWGPHGSCVPGQWSAMDGNGFSIAVDATDFEKRFEWFGELDDPRIKTKETSILDPDFLKPVQEMIAGEN